MRRPKKREYVYMNGGEIKWHTEDARHEELIKELKNIVFELQRIANHIAIKEVSNGETDKMG